MNFLEIIGYFVAVFIFVFANAGGLAGGGTPLPLMMIFFKFDLKRAVVLSNSTVMTSSLIRYLMNA